MSESAPRGIANLATKRKPDPKRMLARNRQDDETPEVEEPAVEAPSAAETTAASAPTPTAPKAPRNTPRTTAEDDGGYLNLERKEARLREGQIGELTTHARRLNKAKTTPGVPRITENTLIRVAIDLLLSHVDSLQGNTEAELRRSLGL